MSENEQPSMHEVLESIRRIIREREGPAGDLDGDMDEVTFASLPEGPRWTP